MWRSPLTLLLAAACTLASAQTPGDDLARFGAWLGGEFNNHEQVWQHRIDVADPKVSPKPAPVQHLHQIVAPFAAPALGSGLLFYVQQSRGAERAGVTLQRVLRVRADAGHLRLEVFRPGDERGLIDAHRQPGRLEALTPSDLMPLSPCEQRWRWEPATRSFQGAASPAGLAAGGTGPDCGWPAGAGALSLTETLLHTGDGGRYRKLRYFSGWVWMKNAGPGAAPEDRKASFARGVLLHTEGQRVPVLLDDGRDSGYELELALLTYQNTRLPILKFTLVEKASGKSHAYTWANPEATLIGINLGWMQAGFTQKAERSAFGW